MIETAKRVAKRFVKTIPYDRRMRFRDIHLIRPAERAPNSPILQFYSSVDNIGNYLPVAAIRDYIGCETDTWCAHKPVDFDFVNANYRGVIIGGAGLIYRPFEAFWRDFAAQCRLPFIIWGVGACLPDTMQLDEAVPFRDSLKQVSRRADLVNVRDDVTADLTSRSDVSITACPTVSYLTKFRRTRLDRSITLAMHPGLASEHDHRVLLEKLEQVGNIRTTTNRQSQFQGIDDIVRRRYRGASTVVSTRLHGAIIAFGLGIPYIALPRDEKLRAFTRIYGGGVAIASASEVVMALESAKPSTGLEKALGQTDSFGRQAADWHAALV